MAWLSRIQFNLLETKLPPLDSRFKELCANKIDIGRIKRFLTDLRFATREVVSAQAHHYWHLTPHWCHTTCNCEPWLWAATSEILGKIPPVVGIFFVALMQILQNGVSVVRHAATIIVN